jgi:hypothetical protein
MAVRPGEGSDMSFPKQIGRAAIGVAILMGSGLSAPPVQAAYTVTLAQEGSNVVATGSGTIDLAGLSFLVSGTGSAAIVPSDGLIETGPSSSEPTDFYAVVFGPPGFGSGAALTFARAAAATPSACPPPHLTCRRATSLAAPWRTARPMTTRP